MIIIVFNDVVWNFVYYLTYFLSERILSWQWLIYECLSGLRAKIYPDGGNQTIVQIFNAHVHKGFGHIQFITANLFKKSCSDHRRGIYFINILDYSENLSWIYILVWNLYFIILFLPVLWYQYTYAYCHCNILLDLFN